MGNYNTQGNYVEQAKYYANESLITNINDYYKNKTNTHNNKGETDASSSNESECEKELRNNKLKDNFPFTFIWKYEGKEVSLIGDFNNWKKPNIMLIDPRTKFHFLRMELPLKQYEFNFIVDGNKTISKDYSSKINSNGILVNVVDLIKQKENEEELKRKAEIKLKIMKRKREEEQKKIEYDSYFPYEEECSHAINIPSQYIPKFNIDLHSRQTNKKIFKDQRFLNFEEKNLLSENNSFKNILNCPHIYLNHLCTCTENEGKNIMELNTAQRIRHKVITIVYYSPVKRN